MSFVFRPGDLPKLDLRLDRGANFKAWKTQWEAYLALSVLGDQDAIKQVQALTLCFTREKDVKAIVEAIQRIYTRFVDSRFADSRLIG